MAQTNDTQQNPNALSTAVYDFSRDALTPQASKLGMTPSQFSAQQTAIMQEDVRQASIQNPGRVVQGAQTGKLSDGTAQYYQNYTTPNQNPAPIVPINNPTTLPITVPNGPKFTSLDGGQTYQKTPIPGGKSTITADVGSGDATALSSSLDRQQAALDSQQAARVAELEQEQKANERSINDVYGNRQNTLESQQIEQQKTQDVLSYRLGRKDTMYGVAEMSNLKRDQALAMNQLVSEQASLIQQSRSALSQGKFELANQFEDKARNLYQQQYQQQQLAFQKQTQMREEQKYVTEQGKDVFNMMALAGKQPSQELYDWYDSSIGVQGIGQSIFEAASAEMQRKSITDAQAAKKMDADLAISVANAIEKTPLGSPITIGDNTYMGTNRGDIPSGTETNKKTGVTSYWELDRATGKPKVYEIGQIGSPQENWSVQKDDQGRLWSVNADTQQIKPFFPSGAQKNWQEVFPEGSTSPFKDANGNPRVQCGEFTNDMSGIGVGDSFESKMAKMNLWTKGQGDPEAIVGSLNVGDVFTQKLDTWTGHVGLVLGTATKDGVSGIYALESNYKPGKVTSTRFIPLSQIDGFGKPPKVHPTLMTGSDAPTFGAKTGTEPTKLTFDQIATANASLPPEKQLKLGATTQDANNAGYVPGVTSSTETDKRVVALKDPVKNEFRDILLLQEQINSLKKLKETQNTGPFIARLSGAAGAFNKGDQELIDMNIKSEEMRSMIMKERSGATVSEEEFKRLASFLPSTTDNDQQFNAKLKQLEEKYSNMMNTQARIYGFKDATDLRSALNVDGGASMKQVQSPDGAIYSYDLNDASQKKEYEEALNNNYKAL